MAIFLSSSHKLCRRICREIGRAPSSSHHRSIAERHQDLEANPPPSDPNPSSSTASTSQQPQDYAHTGRGGAGNWYQPTALAQSGTFTSATDATAIPTSSKPQVSKPWHPETQELPVARAGRGGAGNFVWKDEEKERVRKEEEERRKEEVSEGVQRGVEEELKRPGQVRLGSAKAGRGW